MRERRTNEPDRTSAFGFLTPVKGSVQNTDMLCVGGFQGGGTQLTPALHTRGVSLLLLVYFTSFQLHSVLGQKRSLWCLWRQQEPTVCTEAKSKMSEPLETPMECIVIEGDFNTEMENHHIFPRGLSAFCCHSLSPSRPFFPTQTVTPILHIAHT